MEKDNNNSMFGFTRRKLSKYLFVFLAGIVAAVVFSKLLDLNDKNPSEVVNNSSTCIAEMATSDFTDGHASDSREEKHTIIDFPEANVINASISNLDIYKLNSSGTKNLANDFLVEFGSRGLENKLVTSLPALKTFQSFSADHYDKTDWSISMLNALLEIKWPNHFQIERLECKSYNCIVYGISIGEEASPMDFIQSLKMSDDQMIRGTADDNDFALPYFGVHPLVNQIEPYSYEWSILISKV